MTVRHLSITAAASLFLSMVSCSDNSGADSSPADSGVPQTADARPAAEPKAKNPGVNLGKATIRYADETFELTEFSAKVNSVVQISADFLTFELYGSENFSDSISGGINGAGVGSQPVGTFAPLSMDNPASSEPIGSITSMGFIGDESGITLREGTVTVKKFDADGHLVVEFEGQGSPISDPAALVPMSGEIDVTLKVIDHRK